MQGQPRRDSTGVRLALAEVVAEQVPREPLKELELASGCALEQKSAEWNWVSLDLPPPVPVSHS